MKTRERKQTDLNALTEQLNNSKTAMIIGFNKLTVNKDQEFRNQLRGIGADYKVVKNTLARIAVKGTPYEGAADHLKGVTAIAWTNEDAVILSKTISLKTMPTIIRSKPVLSKARSLIWHKLRRLRVCRRKKN